MRDFDPMSGQGGRRGRGRGRMMRAMAAGFGRGFDPRAEAFDEGESESGFGRGRGRFAGGFGFGPGGFGKGGFGRGGFGGDGDGAGGPFGGRGRRAKRFDGEELRLMVLGLLAEAPQHGYQLIRNFAERSAGAYQPSPGVLYPLLTMLADMDLVEQVEAPSGAGSRRDFRLTAAGEAEIAANSVAIEALFARLGALADVANRMDGGPVRRAVHNLRVALTERLARPGTSDEIAFEVARIIDEATQKIERL